MDAYDVILDKYRATQRFRAEIREETRLSYEAEIKSKCKKDCKLDEERTHCVSCLRTMEEIINCGRYAKEVTEDGETTT